MMLSEGRAGIDSLYSLKDGMHHIIPSLEQTIRTFAVTEPSQSVMQATYGLSSRKISMNGPD